MTIGQRIAQKRKELGLSQEALGSKLGVSRQSIYKWEADSALPEIDKLIALSRLFGVSVGWLLGVEEPPDVALDRILLDRWRRFMLEQAREILRSRVDAGTYQAFELYAEQGRELRRVAEALEMTPNRIYVAKSRCLKTLRQILLELNESDPELELLRDEV